MSMVSATAFPNLYIRYIPIVNTARSITCLGLVPLRDFYSWSTPGTFLSCAIMLAVAEPLAGAALPESAFKFF